jgi:hypothetical protein
MSGEVHSPTLILDKDLVVRLRWRTKLRGIYSFCGSRSVESLSFSPSRTFGLVQCNYTILMAVSIDISSPGNARFGRIMVTGKVAVRTLPGSAPRD